MEKINKLLNNYDALPNQSNWDAVDETFREKYREAQVILEQINKTDAPDEEKKKTINEIDNKLVEMFNQIHNVEIVNEALNETFNDTEPEKNNNNVETDGRLSETNPEPEINTDEHATKTEPTVETDGRLSTIETQTEEILSDFEKSAQTIDDEDMKNKKNVETDGNLSDKKTEPESETNNNVETDGHLSKQETDNNINISEPEPETNNNVETDEHLSKQETDTEVIETDGNPSIPIIEQNPFQPFEAWAATQEVVKASDLVKFGIPAELWKENKMEIVIGNVRLEKTVSAALFNSWVVKK